MSENKKENVYDALKRPAILMLLWACIWAFSYQETLASLFKVWMSSNTYTHCLFVLPISLFFIYQCLPQVVSIKPKPSYFVLIFMVLLQMLWLLGFAGDVEVLKHFAVVSMLPCSIVMFFGWQVARILWFPLFFLLFSVPIGEELVPYFQTITADLSVQFLRWSAVPVYRDGLFITIPNGMFEVAEACSGIRFFIACVVMGSVIAYVNYQIVWKRLVFLMFATVLPIIANGLRAYGTMMIGHFVDMKYASGADHLIYGWWFFAFVVVILVLASRIGSDSPALLSPSSQAPHPQWQAQLWWPITLVSSVPIIAAYIIYSGLNLSAEGVVRIDDRDEWERVGATSEREWMPDFYKPGFEYMGRSVEGARDLYLAAYFDDQQGKELISEKNRLFHVVKWRRRLSRVVYLTSPDSGRSIRAEIIDIGAADGRKRLVLYWYKLQNVSTSNVLEVKLFQSLQMLQGNGKSGAVIALSTPYHKDIELAEKKLMDYGAAHFDNIEAMVQFEN